MLSHGTAWSQIRIWSWHEAAADQSSDADPPFSLSHLHTHNSHTHTHGSRSQNDSSRGLFPSLCLSINTGNVGKGGRKDPKGLTKRMTAAHAPNSVPSRLVVSFFFAFSSSAHLSRRTDISQPFLSSLFFYWSRYTRRNTALAAVVSQSRERHCGQEKKRQFLLLVIVLTVGY